MTDNPPAVRASFWREPLLHFLLIGAALFLLYRVLNGGDTGAPREIVVTPSQVAALKENFSRTWLRPPTPVEMNGLIDDYVREEVFYREAIAMGLDRDDTVVRRRLRQKMEFISEDLAQVQAPSDAELTKFLESHRDQFLEPSRVSFEQVYFSTERRGEGARRDAERTLEALQFRGAARGPGYPGDPSLLPPTMDDASPQDVANAFGEAFAKQLDEAPLQQWSGPLQSTYGLHLVRVTTRTAGAHPSLAEIRPMVLREWQAEQTRRRGDEFYQSLRKKYEVRIAPGARAKP